MRSVFLRSFMVALFVLMVLEPTARAARADRTEEAIEKAAYMNASVERLYKEGRIEEALEAGERAYNIIAETLGPEHPSTATALYNLAVLSEAMGELRRAETLFARALKIREATLGARHRDTINSRIKLTDIRKILAGPRAAGERKPSAKIIRNNSGKIAYKKTTSPDVKIAPMQPKTVNIKTLKPSVKPRVKIAPVQPKTVDIKMVKPSGKPRAKTSPKATAMPRSIEVGTRRAPASSNAGREVKTSAKITKNGSVGHSAASAALEETSATVVAPEGEEAPPAFKTRSLPMVTAENSEGSGLGELATAATEEDFDGYNVKLGVDALMKIPGPAGVLRVWIGAAEYTPEFREGMVEAVGSLPKVGETAKVKAFAPDFEIKPEDSICIKLHPTGSDALFELRPKKKGQFNVSAVVNLYGSGDCSGAAIPKAVETLQVTVKVDAGEVVGERAGEMWEVFWEKFLDFWGAIVALFFGLILFFLRGKLKKIFGFGGGKS